MTTSISEYQRNLEEASYKSAALNTPATQPIGAGRKDDKGKSRMSLIPGDIMIELGDLYAMGASKYEPNNWRKGMDWSRVMDALERHYNAWKDGQKNDPQDGQRHLISVVWNAIALAWYEKHNVGTDDRYIHGRTN